MRWEDCVSEYIEHIRLSMSCNTVRMRRCMLSRISASMGHVNMSDLTIRDVQHMLLIVGDRVKMSSRAAYFYCLRHFLKWASSRGYCDDLYMVIHVPRAPRREPRLPSGDVICRILQWEPDERGCKRSVNARYRAWAVTSLLPLTGLRIGEMSRLTTDHVFLTETPYILVVGKGGHERRVPLSGKACSILRRYLEVRGSFPGPLFGSVYGLRYKPISSSGIHRDVRYVLEQLGIPPFNPHLFRHWFATSLLEVGVDIRTVQELLGHSSLASTQVYLHSSNTKKIMAVEKLAARVTYVASYGGVVG
ncbi:MAG: tyrosine-type recombinase/integrase [Candidatus Methanomethylicaceae archaeon]